MKLQTTLLFLFIASFSFAQITITKNDVPTVGDELEFSIDTLPSGFMPSAPGPDQMWDFSSLGNDLPYTEVLLDPAGTPGGADYPTATAAVAQPGGIFNYIENRPDGVYVLGIYGDFLGTGLELSVPLSPPQKSFELPSTYQTAYNDTYNAVVTIESPIAGADSVRVTNAASAISEIDAYGVVETPNGFYNALRQKVTTTTDFKIEIQVFGFWIEQSSNTSEAVTYNFFNKEVKGRLLSYAVDSMGFAGQITYSTIPGAQGIPPVASFDGADQGSNTFLFTDSSYDGIISRFWDFGDGTTMITTETMISHTYATGGTYEVCLTVENSFGSDKLCKPFSILAAPVAAFTFSDAFEGVVNFQDISTGNPSAWSWNFGDGSTSTDQNPSHTFASPGSYNVCLTVTNSAGDNMVCNTVNPLFKPAAAFSFVDDGTGTLEFTDESTNNPSSWLWDFGDGSTSTQQNPTHDFPSDEHNVCLTATNPAGSNQICKDITVIISSLKDLQNQIGLQVYPNPVSDFLQFRLEEAPEAGTLLMITNSLGQRTYINTLQQMNTISLENWAAGTYFWNINSKKGMVLARGSIMVAR